MTLSITTFQHNYTQHIGLVSNAQHNRHSYSIKTLHHYAECHFAESSVSFIAMLNVAMLSVIMMNVIMLSVVMVNVLAPFQPAIKFESKAGAYPSGGPYKYYIYLKGSPGANTLAYFAASSMVKKKVLKHGHQGPMLFKF
jgi:hypothetical protein